MKIAYFDCAAGISGDMTLGALVDAGVDLAAIQTGVASLGLPEVQIVVENVKRRGFRAAKIRITHPPEQKHRHLHHITEMIDRSALAPPQKDLAKRIFTRLGEAEAKVHGQEIRKVHFHEVGAIDSIADIVGSAIGLNLLGCDRIVFSPIPVGGGFVTMEHGRLSVPAPATAELLRGIPLAESVVQAELTTPTGAAIAAVVADEFAPLPAMSIEQIGYGAGERDPEAQPNLLRLLVGKTADAILSDQVVVLETNLDDVPGEVVGHTVTLLAEAGALDVYTTAVQMKKNRPGVVLTVLCPASEIARLEKIIFRETQTLGIRRWTASRHKLARAAASVVTSLGTVAGKVSTLVEGGESFSPEYEDCRRIAAERNLPLHEVYQAAIAAFQSSRGG